MKVGDLVLTPDGYYGIVTGERQIRLGMGMTWNVEPGMESKVRVLSIHESGCEDEKANFASLLAQKAVA